MDELDHDEAVGAYGASAHTGTTVSVHAGFPNPAAERSGAPLSLDKLLVRHPSSTYFFRIRGHTWHRYGVFDGDLAELDRALERYHRMLDECGVPAEAQQNIFAGTMWRLLNPKE